MAGWEVEAAGKERRREGEAPALGIGCRAPELASTEWPCPIHDIGQ